jgi:hypothetical protein
LRLVGSELHLPAQIVRSSSEYFTGHKGTGPDTGSRADGRWR